jgi:cyanophycinase-like exopeptidase
MLTFQARILKDSEKSTSPVTISRAIGIDEHTALLLEPTTGAVSIVGVGTAYVCTAEESPKVCRSSTPLTFEDVSCTRLNARNKDTFSFATWKGDGVEYSSNILAGMFTNLPYGPL